MEITWPKSQNMVLHRKPIHRATSHILSSADFWLMSHSSLPSKRCWHEKNVPYMDPVVGLWEIPGTHGPWHTLDRNQESSKVWVELSPYDAVWWLCWTESWTDLDANVYKWKKSYLTDDKMVYLQVYFTSADHSHEHQTYRRNPVSRLASSWR